MTPTRAAGLQRLAEALPRLGRDYAARRNTDAGPDGPPAVSVLSPYLRRRLLTEQEVAQAAVRAHGEGAAKFIDEVCWRSYWKGWLEQRPSVWTAYRREVARGQDRLASEGGLRRVHADAIAGRTGIACFDAWARELVERNWLHNHARMWFASIWVFTLRLPWALGADLFLRHLLDGDPASNTLSWRWVAGLHTPGKHYVARAENIARFTNGRFDPAGQLDEDPAPLPPEPLPPPQPLPLAQAVPSGEVALLLHDDDLCPESLPLDGCRIVAVAGFAAPSPAAHGAAAPVAQFAEAAVADGVARAAARFGCPGTVIATADVAGWVAAQPRPVVTPYAPVGPAAVMLDGLEVTRLVRPWDAVAWPAATRGFFQFRTVIPRLLALA